MGTINSLADQPFKTAVFHLAGPVRGGLAVDVRRLAGCIVSFVGLSTFSVVGFGRDVRRDSAPLCAGAMPRSARRFTTASHIRAVS